MRDPLVKPRRSAVGLRKLRLKAKSRVPAVKLTSLLQVVRISAGPMPVGRVVRSDWRSSTPSTPNLHGESKDPRGSYCNWLSCYCSRSLAGVGARHLKKSYWYETASALWGPPQWCLERFLDLSLSVSSRTCHCLVLSWLITCVEHWLRQLTGSRGALFCELHPYILLHVY